MLLRLIDASVRGKNSANMAIVGNRNIRTVSFPLFTNINSVSWALQIALAEASYPLAKIQLYLGRKAFRLKSGDLFLLNYSPLEISNMIVRVLSMEEENLDGERIIVTVQEDINYVANIPSIVGAVGQAQILDLIIEDFENLRYIEPAYVTGETPNRIIPVIARETGTETAASIYLSIDSGTSYEKVGTVTTFAVYGTLNMALGSVDTSDDSFNVTINKDSSYLESDTQAHSKKTNLILIEDEIISFTDIVAESDGSYTISDLARGLFDTTITTHAIGTKMYGRIEKLAQLSVSYLTVGEVYYLKAVPINPQKSGELSDALAKTLTFKNLSLLPRSVNNLSASGVDSSSSDGQYSGEDIVIEWDPRMRGSEETPSGLWECEGLFEVQVWFVDSVRTKVRTVQTTDTDQFFNTWTYTTAMNEEDNGGSGTADEIVFVVYNYIDVDRYSDPKEVTVILVS